MKPHPPTHGPTGSKVVKCSWAAESGDQIVHRRRPLAPTRVVETVDGDSDFITSYELSDEEFAQAAADYERALTEWERTDGMVAIAGPKTFFVDVECENGTTARGWSDDGERWTWTEWMA